MVADQLSIREVLAAPPDLVHAGDANAILRPMLGPSSVLLLDGAEHLHQRRLMLPAFHGARLQRYRDIMVEATDRALAGWRPGDRVSLRPHAQAITLEVIVRAVFGVSDGAPRRARSGLARRRPGDAAARPRRGRPRAERCRAARRAHDAARGGARDDG